MELELFINEQSLNGQKLSILDAQKLFEQILLMIDISQSTFSESKTTLYDSFTLFNTPINQDEVLGRILIDKDLKKKYQNSLEKNWISWRDQIMQDLSKVYTAEGMDFKDTSIGEIYEHRISYSDNIQCVINFKGSRFDNPIIKIYKQDESIQVNGFCDLETFCSFLTEKSLLKEEYSKNSSFPPRDYQTILANHQIFIPIDHTCHSRKVYERIEKNEYWYVDNLHYGIGAHLEVFNKTTKKFIGKCNINNLEEITAPRTKSQKNRTIKFDR